MSVDRNNYNPKSTSYLLFNQIVRKINYILSNFKYIVIYVVIFKKKLKGIRQLRPFQTF